MPATIVFVPGFWEGPTVYNQIADKLQAEGFTTVTATLASTGSKSPGNPSMIDDVIAIRSTIAPIIQQDKDVILVVHSAGGFLGGAAIEGLEASKRKIAGKSGGVSKVVLLAAGILPEGMEHPDDLPFAVYNEDGTLTCKQPRELLFHDVPNANKWMDVLKSQPAKGWNAACSYTPWQHVQSVYVVAKNDKLLPAELQHQFAALTQARIEELDSGHMLPLTKPAEIAAIIQKLSRS